MLQKLFGSKLPGRAAVLVWLVYALTSVGTLGVDPAMRYNVVETLFRTGDVEIVEGGPLTVEHEGRNYSVFFPGQSVSFLPGAAISAAASEMLGVDQHVASRAGQFVAASLIIPAWGALAVLGHMALLRMFGAGGRVCVASGLLLAFATPLWVWASDSSEEAILAACAAWVFVLILAAARVGGRENDPAQSRMFVDRLGLSGVLMAFAMIHRAPFATVVLGAVVLGLPIMYTHRQLLWASRGRFLTWSILSLAVIAIIPAYNLARFGDPLDTGYGLFYADLGGVWDNPLLTGLRGHLVSPGESMFLYAPLLLLFPLAIVMPSVYRRLGAFWWVIVIALAAHLIIYSVHTYWSGAHGWAIRFHVSQLPLAMVPIGLLLDRCRGRNGAMAVVGFLAVLSITIQIAGNALNTGLEHTQQRDAYEPGDRSIPRDAAWKWRHAQLRLRFINIADKLQGKPLLEGELAETARIQTVWNVFPVRAGLMNSKKISTVAWGVWLLLASLAIVTTTLVVRDYRRAEAL